MITRRVLLGGLATAGVATAVPQLRSAPATLKVPCFITPPWCSTKYPHFDSDKYYAKTILTMDEVLYHIGEYGVTPSEALHTLTRGLYAMFHQGWRPLKSFEALQAADSYTGKYRPAYLHLLSLPVSFTLQHHAPLPL